MKMKSPLLGILLVSFGHLCLPVPCSAQVATGDSPATAENSPDPAGARLDRLRESAEAYVQAYNNSDADALARLFLPNGEITLANGDLLAGRDAIGAYFRESFAGEDDPKAALEAGSVRFVAPGIAIEEGILHVTTPSGEVRSHGYSAVQVEQEDGSWLVASVRDSLEDLALPAEKLRALDWILGEWQVQKDGSTTYLAFDWSDDGPFIDGRALTEEAGEQSTTSTYRIGWDALRGNFVSWGFDARGGFTYSEWTRAGGNSWLLRTHGVTADGESNRGTQQIELDPSRQHFSWTLRDQVIGGELQPEYKLIVVHRPPTPPSLSSEAE